MKFDYDIAEVAPYINWVYFYHAWQLTQKAEQQRLLAEARDFLCSLQGRYSTHALFRLARVHAEGDDIVIDDGQGGRIPLLRQQQGDICLCLSDFISPVADEMGFFSTSADEGLEHDFDNDPYQKMMAQLLADRLAEATAELLHEQVRKRLWGYAADERLSISQMHQEQFQGIRPAVGYPSLPDVSLNFLLDRLLDFSRIGISLTESGAMRPHASVSGLMIAHPQARYFAVGPVGEDQLADYARRRGLPVGTVRKFLAANL